MKKDVSKMKFTTKALGLVLSLAIVFAAGCDREDTDEYTVYYQSDSPAASRVITANGDWGTSQAGTAMALMNDMSGFPAKEYKQVTDLDYGFMDVSDALGETRVFLPGKDTDTIYVLDPLNSLNVVDSFTVGPGWWTANPYAVLVIKKDKAYVSRASYGSLYDDVLVVNPSTGAKLGTIDLSAVPNNADGLARPADMIMPGDTVFVTVQDLDVSYGFGDTVIGTGKILTVNPETDAGNTVIDLGYYNPNSLVYSKRTKSVIAACAGRQGDKSYVPHPEESALVAFSIHPPYAIRTIVTGDDAAINGNIRDVALDDLGNAWILVDQGFSFNDRVLKVRLSDGYVYPFVYPDFNTGNEELFGIVHTPEGYIVVGDRANRELAVIDSMSDAAIGYVPLSVPPSQITVVE